ncbi:MAG: 30S ribosomal protein S8 [Candidatus Nanosyncoccaceae bacterium]|jgi:small subunit ribosomal protein S8
MALQSTDPIADFITRIRNAGMVNQPEVTVPTSRMKERIAQTLKDSGYIDSFEVSNDKPAKMIVKLNDSITKINRLSKPGRRLYSAADEIPRVKNGRGIVIISTPKGVMTGEEAKKKRLGGELLLEVY